MQKKYPKIFISLVTDPYRSLEKKYRLTHGIIKLLAQCHYPCLVSILTKSPLVLQDICLFKQFPACEVGLTVTTANNSLGRELEAHAPAAKARLHTLKKLTIEGITTYAFIKPLLSYYVQWPGKLAELVGKLAKAGVRSVYVEHLNPSRYISQRIELETHKYDSAHVAALKEHNAVSARTILKGLVIPLLEQHNICLRTGQLIVHS